MDLKRLFNVPSRRPKPAGVKPIPLKPTFRTRVIFRYLEVISRAGLEHEACHELWRRLVVLHGNVNVSTGRTPRDQVVAWLQGCSDEEFLDTLEMIFHPSHISPSGLEELVDEFNTFLQVDTLPFSITGYVWVDIPQGERFGGGKTLTEYPRVIRADSQVTSATAIMPTLELLSDGRFRVANAEFLNALEDFRRGRHEDCLTKCASSFESVLKVICAVKKWPYKETDRAAQLVKTVVGKAGLAPFLEKHLLQIATLRNELSSSHGGGTKLRQVSPTMAEYGVNVTASAILLVVKHCLQ